MTSKFPIKSNSQLDNKSPPKTSTGGDNFELLQNEDNKILIEKYLTKMGVKERTDYSESNTSSKTKEKVYQKILENRFNTTEDLDSEIKNRSISKRNKDKNISPNKGLKANNSNTIPLQPNLKNLSKYFSTSKEQDGLHQKVSLKNICENLDEKKPDLSNLIRKKKVYSGKRLFIKLTNFILFELNRSFEMHNS